MNDREGRVIWPVPSLVNEDGSIKRFDYKTNVGAEPYVPFSIRKNREGQEIKVDHNAIDFHMPVVRTEGKTKIGPEVVAVADGTIVEIGKGKRAGNFVVLEFHDSDGKKYRATYRHLGTIAHNIKVGGKVRAGDVIGETGDTGNVRTKGIDHPILCFALEKQTVGGWKPLNPYLVVGKLEYMKLRPKVVMNIGNREGQTEGEKRRILL